MRINYIEHRCDRCGKTQKYTRLVDFQTDKWRTLQWFPIGSSMDHADSRPKDLCPTCAREFLVWLDSPLAEGARDWTAMAEGVSDD